MSKVQNPAPTRSNGNHAPGLPRDPKTGPIELEDCISISFEEFITPRVMEVMDFDHRERVAGLVVNQDGPGRGAVGAGEPRPTAFALWAPKRRATEPILERF